MPPECQLFGTPGCRLCEVAESVLLPLAIEHGLMVELIDISEDEQLFERYELCIPVLRRIDTGEELEWPFDEPQVVSFLSR
ncbi:hypothetical protein ALQ33_00704 [Pseudomonas syringae pv. philadelphi]|uniref:Thiol-disulfide isomerase and thioredoxin n=1 Tax=Pseudomonas syringae pv. philadelphi TaxID=251706 RepID=A0A3M3ZBN9_9PSED|nr:MULTISPECIES: glutaredoxin family protein [Pseudomonas syringae group]RMO92057.1 hypothetical protein ALQ33_00704 [Pseudomonas syringae pv. philadelphi]SDW52167.1 Glutaredoxin-like domain [Pseudomonas syringae]SFL77397.1 Glutaredoxin-like domain [Pseudomonas syringae]